MTDSDKLNSLLLNCIIDFSCKIFYNGCPRFHWNHADFETNLVFHYHQCGHQNRILEENRGCLFTKLYCMLVILFSFFIISHRCNSFASVMTLFSVYISLFTRLLLHILQISYELLMKVF